jgi:hypothetical protein
VRFENKNIFSYIEKRSSLVVNLEVFGLVPDSIPIGNSFNPSESGRTENPAKKKLFFRATFFCCKLSFLQKINKKKLIKKKN